MFLSIPLVAILKVVCDHIEPLKPRGVLQGGPRLAFFPGPTIGHLAPRDAMALLERVGLGDRTLADAHVHALGGRDLGQRHPQVVVQDDDRAPALVLRDVQQVADHLVHPVAVPPHHRRQVGPAHHPEGDPALQGEHVEGALQLGHGLLAPTGGGRAPLLQGRHVGARPEVGQLTIETEADDVSIQVDFAGVLGLLVNELVTRAVQSPPPAGQPAPPPPVTPVCGCGHALSQHDRDTSTCYAELRRDAYDKRGRWAFEEVGQADNTLVVYIWGDNGSSGEGQNGTISVIHSDPEILGGTPVFVGTRVPLKNLIDYLEGGHSLEEFLDDFPSVTREQSIAALEEAKHALIARARAA